MTANNPSWGVYAWLCATYVHPASGHLLGEAGDVREGPYICQACGCSISQHSPTTGLSKKDWQARYPDGVTGQP